jgi:hypothetical protein
MNLSQKNALPASCRQSSWQVALSSADKMSAARWSPLAIALTIKIFH